MFQLWSSSSKNPSICYALKGYTWEDSKFHSIHTGRTFCQRWMSLNQDLQLYSDTKNHCQGCWPLHSPDKVWKVLSRETFCTKPTSCCAVRRNKSLSILESSTEGRKQFLFISPQSSVSDDIEILITLYYGDNYMLVIISLPGSRRRHKLLAFYDYMIS